MFPDFSPAPNTEAAAMIAGKSPVVKSVFKQLLPEIKLRAFTVAGVESANALQRIRDAVSSVPLGDQTWDQAKKQIVEELEPYLGEGADYRATLVLRTNGFQAFSTVVHNAGMADEDTTAFQYLHGECQVPTPSHLALNGIIVSKDDPFWDTHTGPWGHLGCVCYKRPLNPDFVDDEREADKKKNPEDRNVMEGAALRKLNEGEIIRNGQRHDISIDGPDNSGFSWHPGDLRLPIGDILQRYDPEVRDRFETFAKKTAVNGTTVWSWLMGGKQPKRSREEIAREDVRGARKKLANAPQKSNEETDRYDTPEILSQDSERYFAAGQSAFGQFRAVWGAGLADQVVRDIETEWSAQIAAVVTGRKPLFHEAIGDAALPVANALRKILPAGVEVRAGDNSIFIYRPEVVSKLADDTKPLWPQVKAHSDNGYWLGYGAQFLEEPTLQVNVLDPDGRKVAGFRGPLVNPEKFAQARADDYTLATGKPYSAVIVRPD